MSTKLIFPVSFLLAFVLAPGLAEAQSINQDPGPDGIVSVEAEHFDANVKGPDGDEWVEVGPTDGFTGELGMQVPQGNGNHITDYVDNSERLDYEINFVKTGTHYIWILAWGPDGGGDSCHAGLDGEGLATSDNLSGWNANYHWSNARYQRTGAPTVEVATPGVHTFNIWVREDGLIIDKIVLTTNPDFSLSGTEPGPPESPRGARVVASNPTPPDGATDVPRDVELGWESGAFAATHDVYLGTVFADVNAAGRTNPLNVLASRGQLANSYSPAQRLEFAQTYYWRIDEVNAPPANTVHKGTVWSFTTEVLAYPVTNIIATASSSAANKGPENTVNGSGLDSSGLHGNTGEGTMWLSDAAGPQPTWILFEFDKVHKLHEMWVWNSNESLELVIGLGFKDVTIEYSADGVDFTTFGTTHEFAQGSGAAGYAHNTTVDMGGVPAKYVRFTANSNWAGLLPQFGLSEVQFFSIPVQAREPSPAAGATDVALDLDLSWRAGRQAATHEVYFSEDYLAVLNGAASVTTVNQASYGPLALDLGKTYYWRIDEVNDVETPALWQGEVWDFKTVKSLVIDDFESYNDIDPPDPQSNRIFETWIDGFGVATNGALVGNDLPPYAEQTIVHSGRQSMPYFYDNSAGYSEATLTLSSQRDWTVRGIGELTLWFRGYPASVGSFVEGPAGVYTMTASGADIWGTADQFHFAYKQLSGAGSIVARVESVQNTNVWAKAGVMIRETLDAGSKFAAVYITPTNADGTPTQGCRFQGRTDTGGSATSDSSPTNVTTPEQIAVKAPYWVKIERDVAGSFRGYYASDGVNWQPLAWRPAISMDTNVYIGLALTSHDAALTGEAKFSNVQTSGAVTGQWQAQDIGILSNSGEPMHVAVANKSGAPAVVYHEDAGAAQIDTWTQWRIDVQQFADQGVNLTDVDSISIGLGDKSNPQPGGSGILYFDDIGLSPRPAPLAEVWLEAEAADVLGASWRTYDDPTASGAKNIGSDDGDGNDNNVAPPAEWIASYSFTAPAGQYKVLLRGQEAGADSFWVRIPTAITQTHEHPGQPGTGWVRFNGMDAPAGWAWDEVHSDDHSQAVVNWTLGDGANTLEIGKREDGVLLDAILITNNLDQDPGTLPEAIPQP